MSGLSWRIFLLFFLDGGDGRKEKDKGRPAGRLESGRLLMSGVMDCFDFYVVVACHHHQESEEEQEPEEEEATAPGAEEEDADGINPLLTSSLPTQTTASTQPAHQQQQANDPPVWQSVGNVSGQAVTFKGTAQWRRWRNEDGCVRVDTAPRELSAARPPSFFLLCSIAFSRWPGWAGPAHLVE